MICYVVPCRVAQPRWPSGDVVLEPTFGDGAMRNVLIFVLCFTPLAPNTHAPARFSAFAMCCPTKEGLFSSRLPSPHLFSRQTFRRDDRLAHCLPQSCQRGLTAGPHTFTWHAQLCWLSRLWPCNARGAMQQHRRGRYSDFDFNAVDSCTIKPTPSPCDQPPQALPFSQTSWPFPTLFSRTTSNMGSDLHPVVHAHFLSVAEQPESLTHANFHTNVTFRQKTGFARGAPDGTWTTAGGKEVAVLTIFGIVLNADVSAYGTGANAKSLEVSVTHLA